MLFDRQLTDYLGLDWSGSLELSTELEPFKAVNMECDNSVKAERHQLSISVHVTCEPTMHLYLYSPYWLINDTGLPIQIRVGLTYTCCAAILVFLLCPIFLPSPPHDHI